MMSHYCSRDVAPLAAGPKTILHDDWREMHSECLLKLEASAAS